MLIFSLITSLPSEGLTPKPDKRAGEIYEKGIKMLFTQNVGQIPNDEVVFYTIHPSVIYILRNGKININGITIDFGKEPKFITGDMEQITRVSYFGNNKSISGIATYKRVVLREVYPNVDVILTADGRGVIEFQYIVKPGGNVEDIRVKVEGEIKVKEDGIYVVEGEREVVKLSDIKAYQGADEVKVRAKVKGGYISFEVGEYDKKETLVMDPVLTAIVASSWSDVAYSVAIDGSGNVFVAGYTENSSDFAPSRNVFGTTGGWSDAFVSKLSNDLSTHIATAILASSSDDYANSVAIDSSGNAFVAGETYNSLNFAPNRNVFGTAGGIDAFVSKLSNDLSTHIATVILTSSDDDVANSVAIDSSENVFVAGETGNSSNFAPEGGRVVFGDTGLVDVFVSKLSNDLSTLIATAILTSAGNDGASALAIDGSGNVFVVGYTMYSSSFAPIRDTFGTTGSDDAFVSKLSNDLGTHIATAILASSDGDYARSVAIDNSGNVFVAGYTLNSSNFAPSRNVFGTSGGGDAFVSKLNNNLSIHIATAILTSSLRDVGNSVAIDNSGNVFVAGMTFSSSDFAPSRTVFGNADGIDAFASKLSNDLSTHIATAILASSSSDGASSAVLDNSGNVFVAGMTGYSSDFTHIRNIFGTAGGRDAFVSRLYNTIDIAENVVFPQREVITLAEGEIIITLQKPSYVGVNVYSPNGRLVKRFSFGYLPAGEHRFKLDVKRGVYILKVRIGEKVEEVKGVF